MASPARTESIGLPPQSSDLEVDQDLIPPPKFGVSASPTRVHPPVPTRPIVLVPTSEEPVLPFAPEPDPVAVVLTGVAASTEPAAAPVTPSLPTIAPISQNTSPVAGPAAQQPFRHGPGVTARVGFQVDPAESKKAVAKQRRGCGLVRTVGLGLLAAILGAGANVGYSYWEDSADDVTATFDGRQLETWPQVELPAIRFADSTTVFRTAGGTRTVTSHTNMVSGDRIVGVTDTDLAGVVTAYRGAEALVLAGPPLVDSVFTISDIFPNEVIPFVTVLEGAKRQFPVGPISRARTRRAAAQAVKETPAKEPAKSGWQYRAIIDTETFRNREPAAFETWQRRLGAVAVARIEAWIDRTGIVRQVAIDVDGTSIIHTLISGAAESTKFEVQEAPVGVPGAGGGTSVTIEVTE
jgi:hypothetical protein